VNASLHRQLNRRKRRILRRIENQPGVERHQPMMAASNIRYEIAERTRAISPGGIGAIHLLARKIGLIEDIDRGLHLLKRHQPYFESDHVLNIAYNLMAGGSRIEHLEVRRNDEVYLDALGATRIPDPTTAGDFCRRFTESDVKQLMEAFNETRIRVWKEQPADFFEEAFIDADGTLAPTGGWCKQGVDIAYDGTWGYHPLVVSLANTAEPLFLVNRSGNRPSHEQADVYLDKAAALCQRAGFKRITFRGDTDFSQTKHLDRWDRAGHRFIFGIAAMSNLVAIAEGLSPERYSELERPARYTIKTTPRQARERHKEQVVRQRQFDTLKLLGEEVAEFEYAPVACEKSYRVIVLRKKLVVEKGQMWLFEPDRFFFYITNDRTTPASEIVFLANDRCDQENLIGQLKGGVKALTMPVDTLVSNWAYLVMASLAWSLKAWAALLVPEHGRWSVKHRAERRSLLRMEFSTFCVAMIQVPCQVVRTSRRILYRLLSWNPWQGVFLRLVERLHGRRLC
jgi:Transposase DDE domain group 1